MEAASELKLSIVTPSPRPIYGTPEWDEFLKKEAEEKERRDHWWRHKHVVDQLGPRYKEASLENYTVYHDAQKAVLEKVRTLCRGMDEFIQSRRGVFLYGAAGTGKDHLLAVLLRVATKFTTASWIGGWELRTNKQLWESPRWQVNVIGVSDLTNPAGKTADWEIAQALELVDARYRAGYPLWVTGNYPTLEDAEEQLGTPLFERLVENAELIHCYWPSFRTRHLTA